VSYKFLQVSYRCLTGVLQMSYRCHTGVLQVSYRCLTGKPGNSGGSWESHSKRQIGMTETFWPILRYFVVNSNRCKITLFNHESFVLLVSIITNLGLFVSKYNLLWRNWAIFKQIKSYLCMSGFFQCRKSRILEETFHILTQAPRNSVNYFQVCLQVPYRCIKGV
jgi:hypothetical protein